MFTRRALFALCMMLILAGCSARSVTQPGELPLGQPAPLETGKVTDASMIPPEASSNQTLQATLPQSPLQLIIDNPKEGDVLNSTTVKITGRTAPGAVVSVNDVFTIADQNGNFSLETVLDQGLQLVQVEASNSAGEDVIVLLSIEVQPE